MELYKSLRGLTLLILLTTPLLLTLHLIPNTSVYGNPGFPYTFQSRPQTHATTLTVSYATNAYDELNGTKASFTRDAQGYFELKSFTDAVGYNITHVDFKVRFYAEQGNEIYGDLYRILYLVSPSTTETELVAWTSEEQTLQTYVWTDQPEPNDGNWSWTDIKNVQLRVETNPQGAPDNASFDLYEAWITVYYSLPYVSVEPPQLTDKTLQVGSLFTVNITVDYVERLWAYQFELSFNPAVLQGVSYANGPFLGSAGGRVMWLPGQGFDNTAGKLWLFGAALAPKVKFPTGGGVLANITFEVVEYGTSRIKFEADSGLQDPEGRWIVHIASAPVWDPKKGEYVWRDHTPEAFVHGFFDNRHICVEPSRVRGVPVDQTFKVNVSVKGVQDLYSWSVYMNWTALLLDATEISEGDFLKDQPEGTAFYYETHYEEGYIYANCTTIGAHPGVSGSGVLATVTFQVKDNGNTLLHFYDTSLLNSIGQPISIPTSDGWFTNVKHTLTIDAQTVEIEPLPEVPFTLDGTQYTTPFSGNLEEKEYTIIMPSKTQLGGVRYDFVNWTDGIAETQRIIDLTMDISLTANYKAGAFLIHNIDTHLNYSSIQGAIDAEATLDGHTIAVEAGIFYESVTLYKSLRLIGENPYTTILDGKGAESTIYVTADNVFISGFTIQGSTDQGINLYGSQNSNITRNIITVPSGYGVGVQIEGSIPEDPADKNTISDNVLVANDVGIYIAYSNNNTIIGNSITLTSSYGLQLQYSANNTIIGNYVSDNYIGLYMYEYNNSTLIGNTILNNTYGLYIASNTNNLTIYHNNFINSTAAQVLIESTSLGNDWDNGYPSGGNYWSDYTGVDEMSGPSQNEPGSDGIGDTLKEIDADNKDNYPLMSQWRGHVTIDLAVVSDNRVDVGANQKVAFHAKWSLDDTNVTTGTIYVNGTGHSVNATGWISFNHLQDTVGKKVWTVTGVLSNYITAYEYLVDDPYIIWDRVTITLSAVDNRINVGEATAIMATKVYSYDGATFTGSVTLNNTLLAYDTVGKRGYTVASILDPVEGITAFQSNSVYCIWDRIKIVEGGVSNTQTNITQTETVWFQAVYEYDEMSFDGSTGTLYVSGSPMMWAASLNRWEREYTFSTPGARIFQISAVSDSLYELSLINDTVGPLTITWNDFRIVLDGTTYNIPITTNSTVSNMAFDMGARQLSFSVDGPVGTVGFCNVSIPKTFMWGEWTVMVDNTPVDYELREDADYTYIYFTYTHSTHDIKIISTYVVPEFPTLTSVLFVLVLVAFTLMMTLCRQRRKTSERRLGGRDQQ